MSAGYSSWRPRFHRSDRGLQPAGAALLDYLRQRPYVTRDKSGYVPEYADVDDMLPDLTLVPDITSGSNTVDDLHRELG